MRPVALALSMTLAAFYGAATLHAAHSIAPTAALTVTPSSQAGSPGTTFTVDVNLTVKGDTANAVDADIGYPSTVSYVSTAVNGSLWGVTANVNGGNGTVSIQVGTRTPVTNARVATITFRVRSSGSSKFHVLDSSLVASATTNDDLLPTCCTYSLAGSTHLHRGSVVTYRLKLKGTNVKQLSLMAVFPRGLSIVRAGSSKFRLVNHRPTWAVSDLDTPRYRPTDRSAPLRRLHFRVMVTQKAKAGNGSLELLQYARTGSWHGKRAFRVRVRILK